jgi:transcriptional antiterminator RfaH
MNEKLNNFSHLAVRSVDRLLMNQSGHVSGMAWYVVQTKPLQEARALEQLRREGYGSFLPAVEIEQNLDGALQVTREPRFSRYLLIQLDDVEGHRARLLRMPSVTGLLYAQGRLAAVPEPVVAALLKEAEHDGKQSAPGQLADEGRQLDDGVSRALSFVELLSRPQSVESAPARIRRAA